MSFGATTYNVMIASPGDVATERTIARDVIAEWNAVHAAARHIVLLPVGWETHAVPTMGMQPQDVINEQVLRTADLLVGIFWTRIGTATSTYASGTVEEIERHIAANKPVMLYFSSAPIPPDLVVPAQYEQLQAFRASVRSRGLFETFTSATDFREKFRRQLQQKVNNDGYFMAAESTIQTLAVDLARLQTMLSQVVQSANSEVIEAQAIAEAQRSAQMAREAQVEAEAVARERLQDLMVMTHEIQAPLIGVVGALSSITGTDDDGTDRELIEHARALVEDAITVSFGTFTTFAMTAGRQTAFVREEIDIISELNKLTRRLQRTNPRAEIHFELRAETQLPPLYFDRRVFTSVMYNLLHNALKYADDGTSVLIECTHNTDGETVCRIKSTGQPIQVDEKMAIFDRFRRGRSVEGRHGYGGVGLGLWVARELMRATTGDLTLQLSDAFPRLSTFNVHFPRTNHSDMPR